MISAQTQKYLARIITLLTLGAAIYNLHKTIEYTQQKQRSQNIINTSKAAQTSPQATQP